MDVQFRKLGILPDAEQDRTVDVDTRQVEKAMREIAKGRSVSQVAEKLSIPRRTAEVICRIVLTHPGISADAVMNKIGL